MKRELYEQAMNELEQLHEHLHLHVADGPDLWAGQVLTMFRRAVGERPAGAAESASTAGADLDEEFVILTEEPLPQPSA